MALLDMLTDRLEVHRTVEDVDAGGIPQDARTVLATDEPGKVDPLTPRDVLRTADGEVLADHVAYLRDDAETSSPPVYVGDVIVDSAGRLYRVYGEPARHRHPSGTGSHRKVWVRLETDRLA